jgi:membrane protease YdiL (CAAX protease family)
MEKKGGYKLLSNEKRLSPLISVLIAIAAGAVLSVINTLIFNKEVSFDFSLLKLLVCLNPAIYEEMACRAIFMAFCVNFINDTEEKKMNIFDIITMYFMMIVPHTVIHGYGLLPTLLLCVLFGLPFALLQRKRDIASAMISHGIVDAVRFTLTGF